MISHELRTPLTSIKGFTETLLAPDVEWEATQIQEFVQIIDTEADRLAALVGDLTDISCMQAGILRVTTEPSKFSAVLDEASSRMQAVTTEHHLVLDIPDELPLIQADSGRIAEVLVNLVDNAAKYSPSGTQILVSARQEGAEVRIDIADEGQGIALEDRIIVFQPFRQLDQSSLHPLKGSGLGLAICKGLVEAHNRKIWIQERPGPGTTISFTLPCTKPVQGEAD